ncbi:MAG TPA: ATP-binding protein [Falsiroseomonas sp.]|jgi:two-component system phosphate regulon sensor histidine kinase PhoR|nr:ATP-binding protein [Falsiroseomonas sp.]
MPVAAPRASRLLAAAALIGGVPAMALLLLLLGGWLATLPALLALVATGAAAIALARVWLGNLQRLGEAIRRAEAGEGELPALSHRIVLPSVAEIAEDVRRLARSANERAELVMRLRRADTAIIERLPDPLVVLDARGAALRANAVARSLFGTGTGLNAGAAGDLAALLRHPALADALDATLAGGGPRQVDIALPVPVQRDLLVHVILMEPPLSDGGRIVLLLSDRTRERAVERMRADFVANASHELRTPLASLIGFIETLRGPAHDDPEARIRFLGIMAEQSERMRRLIDDLLGLSRIEITEHQPPTGEVDLAALAAAEAEAMAPILTQRRASLETTLEPGSVAAPADPEQLAQVLRNLLENAARYGREGGTIRLAVARIVPGGEGAAPRWPSRPGVVLSVADEGPGIARQHIPRLTERFYRVDRGRSRNAGGTGLGLAIVKHIVNRHRGQLVIESEEGAGATFTVWLPAGSG